MAVIVSTSTGLLLVANHHERREGPRQFRSRGPSSGTHACRTLRHRQRALPALNWRSKLGGADHCACPQGLPLHC